MFAAIEEVNIPCDYDMRHTSCAVGQQKNMFDHCRVHEGSQRGDFQHRAGQIGAQRDFRDY